MSELKPVPILYTVPPSPENPKAGVIAGAAVAIVAMVLVVLLVKGTGSEQPPCYSYANHEAGKFVVVVNNQSVAFANDQREADKIMESYKECKKK